MLLHRRRREPGFVEQGAQLPVGGIEVGEAGRHVDPEHLELVGDVPGTDPELEPSVGQEVDDRRFLGEVERVPDRRQRHRGADPGPARACGHGGREHERLGEVAVVEAVVLGEPDAVGAELVGLRRDLDQSWVVLAPRRAPFAGVATIDEEPDLECHRGRLTSLPRGRQTRSTVRTRSASGELSRTQLELGAQALADGVDVVGTEHQLPRHQDDPVGTEAERRFDLAEEVVDAVEHDPRLLPDLGRVASHFDAVPVEGLERGAELVGLPDRVAGVGVPRRDAQGAVTRAAHHDGDARDRTGQVDRVVDGEELPCVGRGLVVEERAADRHRVGQAAHPLTRTREVEPVATVLVGVPGRTDAEHRASRPTPRRSR